MGNAERLVARFGDRLRFCHPWRTWLVWDGKRWRRDSEARVIAFAKDTVRSIYHEVANAPDKDKRKEILKWAIASEKVDRVRAMVTLAQSERPVVISPSAFDRNPYLLNVDNGTLDLKSGTLRPHSRDDYITKIAPVAYDSGARRPRWDAFLERVLPDPAVRAFVQRAAGYSLTGDISEHALFFLLGEGANGKTTLLRTLQDLLGTHYAIQVAAGLLMDKHTQNHPTEVADLFGTRFAVTSEVSGQQRFDEVLLKQLTGGDRVRARRMREDHWEFIPTHHLWVAANHRPRVDGTDHAVWRRIHLVPFTVQIPKADRDKHLLRALQREGAGILNWAVEGCIRWLADGLAPPEAVRAATSDYRQDMDVLGPFLDECCVRCAGATVGATILYAAYSAWCSASGTDPVNQRAFGTQLTERGLARRKSGGIAVYVDLTLRGHEGAAGDLQGRSGPSFGMNGLGGAREDVHVETRSASSPLVPSTGSGRFRESGGIIGRERHRDRRGGSRSRS